MPFAVLTAVIALMLATPAPQSVIRGRVTDDVSGAAIARAVVKLTFLGPGSQKWEAATSDDGRFEFQKLPAAASSWSRSRRPARRPT